MIVRQQVDLPSAPCAVWLMDSITQVTPQDAGAIVVSGSHGGTSSAHYALAAALALAVFNDAGVGKDKAGLAALDILQSQGRAALTVSHSSARIGDAADAWMHGVVSHANANAKHLGFKPGQGLQAAIANYMGRAGVGPLSPCP
ncbi:hypothetical protein [Limnohabitans sp.]|uniref:hypothetical protein n=1 Tax=Limnohabitans sp. TaxID=1907725 RepID=UPI00391C22E8